MKGMSVTIEGLAPCIMHNGQTSDPLNRFAKAMKEITGKRQKSDRDHEALARLEWEAGLYLGEVGDGNQKKVVVPVWPGENLTAMIVASARAERLGKMFEKSIRCPGMFPMIYDGPKDLEELYALEQFVSRKSVVLKGIRVMRTRPVFPLPWGLEFIVYYNEELVNKKQVTDCVKRAGSQVGLGDWRPVHGVFRVVEINDVKVIA